jgi:hypothetical protein
VKALSEFPPGSTIAYNCAHGGIRNGWVFKDLPTWQNFDPEYSFRIQPKEACIVLGQSLRKKPYIIVLLFIRNTIVEYYTNENHPEMNEPIWYEI